MDQGEFWRMAVGAEDVAKQSARENSMARKRAVRAMLSAIALGAVAGLLTGYLTMPEPFHRADGLTHWLGNYSWDAVTWALIGGFAAFCAVHASKLFTR